MKINKFSLVVLVILALFIAFGCATSKSQTPQKRDCLTKCNSELKACKQACYEGALTIQDAGSCVQECDKKAAQCKKSCSDL
jgi:hypothetical protein